MENSAKTMFRQLLALVVRGSMLQSDEDRDQNNREIDDLIVRLQDRLDGGVEPVTKARMAHDPDFLWREWL